VSTAARKVYIRNHLNRSLSSSGPSPYLWPSSSSFTPQLLTSALYLVLLLFSMTVCADGRSSLGKVMRVFSCSALLKTPSSRGSYWPLAICQLVLSSARASSPSPAADQVD
jgi:hypothetical protein